MTEIEILKKIALDLNIKKGNSETEELWLYRVLCSYIGINVLAASFDYPDEIIKTNTNITISMQHLTHRAEKLLKVFNFTPIDIEKICKLYKKTGYLLHKNNRYTYPKLTCGTENNFTFFRGSPPSQRNFVCGLIPYAINSMIKTSTSLEKMFLLNTENSSDYVEKFLKNIKWEYVNQLPENIVYANLKKGTKDCWTEKSIFKNNLAVCKSEFNGIPEYFLLKTENDSYFRYVFSEWETKQGIYRRVILSLRDNKLLIEKDGEIIKLNTNSLLPFYEQNFFELITWSYDNKPWNRIINTDFLPIIEKLFARFDFTIQEKDTTYGNNTEYALKTQN
ncbi:MAG: hypothetical protein LBM93_14325 [Oscillospiraceae bacterium]|jgi:hypothetical protein|nr:hypothetical protein [Oscillospiraceae bacterium]